MENELNAPYRVEVDQVTKGEWSALIQRFGDGNLFQTWSYGAVRWGEDRLSHLVLRKGDQAIAMAQAVLFTVPVIGKGIAYVPNGPLWRLCGTAEEPDHLRAMTRSMRAEYVERRGLLLRLLPNEIEEPGTGVREIVESEGFQHASKSFRPLQTFVIDLSPPMEELRKGLARRWKRSLGFAEKQGIAITRGDGETLVEILRGLHGEMVGRKGFVPGVNIDEYSAIQRDLPEFLKLKVIVCEFEKRPVSALAVSLIGERCIAIVAGTSGRALELKSSYLMHWKMIEWLKECGARWYDLGGYDPGDNPGTAFFKAGLPGREARFVGQFDAAGGGLESFLVASFDKARLILGNCRGLLTGVRHKLRSASSGRSPEGE